MSRSMYMLKARRRRRRACRPRRWRRSTTAMAGHLGDDHGRHRDEQQLDNPRSSRRRTHDLRAGRRRAVADTSSGYAAEATQPLALTSWACSVVRFPPSATSVRPRRTWSPTVIVITGAAVRLTGSGLGCSDWPTCEEDQFVASLEHHALIESGNRLFTDVTIAVVLAVLGSIRRG